MFYMYVCLRVVVSLLEVTYVSSDATLRGVLLPIMPDTIVQRGISKINKHRGDATSQNGNTDKSVR